ncbi:MAG TPA: DUF2378 family protein [Polyangiales bacterium]
MQYHELAGDLQAHEPGHSEFLPPKLDAHLDLRAALERIPPAATAKAMFVKRLLRELACRGLPLPFEDSFLAFQDVPLALCAELNVHAARVLHPGLPLLDGLRRVARWSFETFQDSVAGQLILTGTQRNPHPTLALASRLVSLTTNVGTLQSVYLTPNSRLIRARDSYFFPESFGVGMAEGVLNACDKQGHVLVRAYSPTDVDFLIGWGA